MSTEKLLAVVAGGLGTDVFGLELKSLVGKGELGFGGRLHIGAGGKSRNIAEMMAVLLGKNRVAMVGKTSRDPLNFWRVPLDALKNAGVNVNHVKVLSFEAAGKFPQVALIAVDQQGANQIYVLPGVNEDFNGDDIAEAKPAFTAAAANDGLLAISLEMPMATAVASVRMAAACGLRTVVDPGGIRPELDCRELLRAPIYLLKPNEHELRMLTGFKIDGESDARKAATTILETSGVKNVLVTLGASGAYLIGKERSVFIPVSNLLYGNSRDETGCGDQTMAALCAALLRGHDLETSARQAVLAGTLQFYKAGIVPVTRQELNKAIKIADRS